MCTLCATVEVQHKAPEQVSVHHGMFSHVPCETNSTLTNNHVQVYDWAIHKDVCFRMYIHERKVSYYRSVVQCVTDLSIAALGGDYGLHERG